MTKPRVLLPVALGTNRDHDLAEAFRAAGADPEQVPLAALRTGERKLADYQLLGISGGFSYGDALGAGRLLGLDLAGWFADELAGARERETPIIGICNGFQALVRAGLLPGDGEAVLSENLSRRFECRWVTLEPNSGNPSIWLSGLSGPIRCPVAHGEGRYVDADLTALAAREGVAFRYLDGHDRANGAYPANPNGSPDDIAGVTDATGLVLGLMPHPENHYRPAQDVLRGRVQGGQTLPLFEAAVAAVAT